MNLNFNSGMVDLRLLQSMQRYKMRGFGSGVKKQKALLVGKGFPEHS
jgi:hypothetical protein